MGFPEGRSLSTEEWTAVLAILAAIIIILAGLIVFFYQQRPACPRGITYPHQILTSDPTDEGYEIEVEGVSELAPLDEFEISVFKNGEEWGGFPIPLKVGEAPRGPAGEYLRFFDLNSDGNLSRGDFFILEDLESGAEYELVFLWAACDERLNSETINVP